MKNIVKKWKVALILVVCIGFALIMACGEISDEENSLELSNEPVERIAAKLGMDFKDLNQKEFEQIQDIALNGGTYEFGNKGVMVIPLGSPKDSGSESQADDATVDQNHPSTNYGSDTVLTAGYYSGLPTYYTFVKNSYNSIDCPSSGAEIDDAELRIYRVSMSYSTSAKACRPTSSWSESTITWSSMPSFTNCGSNSTISSGTGYEYVNAYNVVDDYCNDGYTYRGFVIKGGTSEGYSTFKSYDSGSNWVYLIIEYTICECTSGTCCDGCDYKSSSTVCDTDADCEYGCPWGTSCGDDVGERCRDRYCSGSSASCNGSLGSWKSWSVADSCSAMETCAYGDGSCNYDAGCADDDDSDDDDFVPNDDDATDDDDSVPTLDAPSNLTVDFIGQGTLGNYAELSWQDNTLLETGFELQQKQGLIWDTIASLPRNTEQTTTSGLVCGEIYKWRVRAKALMLVSPWSNIATGTMQCGDDDDSDDDTDDDDQGEDDDSTDDDDSSEDDDAVDDDDTDDDASDDDSNNGGVSNNGDDDDDNSSGCGC